MRRKKNTSTPKQTPQTQKKWVIKEGGCVDSTTFTNGEVEINFDEWIERYYNK